MMKKILGTVFLCVLALPAFAAVELPSTQVRFERDANSKRKQKLTVPMTLVRTGCVRYSETPQVVFGPHASCGYETVYEYSCYTHCWEPGNNSCETTCNDYPVSRLRSCHHEEIACVEIGVTSRAQKNVEVVLRFGRSARLGENEKESFQIQIKQSNGQSNDVRVNLLPEEVVREYRYDYGVQTVSPFRSGEQYLVRVRAKRD